MVKNQGPKQRGQRILGHCWQWEANGQCTKGDNCSFRHDINKRAKMTQPNPSPNSFMQQNERNAWRTSVPEEKVPVVECLDGPARIASEELAPIHSVKSGTLQNACSTSPRVDPDLEKSALMRIARLMNSLAKGPKNDDKRAVAMLKKYDLHGRTEKPVVCRDTRHEHHGPVVCNSSNARQLVCVFHDMKPPKSISRKSSDMQKPIQRVKFTNASARHTKTREQNPSLGYICPVNLISAAPTLQNLRIGLRRRQNGKSKVPAKQCGSWPKTC